MAAPAFKAAGTVLGGANSAAANIPVPAGVATGDIILVFLYHEVLTGTLTPPAGFTLAGDMPQATADFMARVYWKRATGADTGTYNFTHQTSAWREGVAVSFSGCVATGSPFDVTAAAIDNTSNTTTPAVSVTTTGVDRLLVHAAYNFGGGTTTFGGGFTKRTDAGEIAVATLAQASAGSSGSLTATHSSAAVDSAWLGALLPVASTPQDTTRFFFGMDQ